MLNFSPNIFSIVNLYQAATFLLTEQILEYILQQEICFQKKKRFIFSVGWLNFAIEILKVRFSLLNSYLAEIFHNFVHFIT